LSSKKQKELIVEVKKSVDSAKSAKAEMEESKAAPNGVGGDASN
jgi:hypothetical protein